MVGCLDLPQRDGSWTMSSFDGFPLPKPTALVRSSWFSPKKTAKKSVARDFAGWARPKKNHGKLWDSRWFFWPILAHWPKISWRNFLGNLSGDLLTILARSPGPGRVRKPRAAMIEEGDLDATVAGSWKFVSIYGENTTDFFVLSLYTMFISGWWF